MIKLLIKIPTRGRASKFLPLLKEYLSKIKNPHTQILVSIDLDDMSMNNHHVISQIKSLGAIVEKGFSKNKIDAINRDINMYIANYDVLMIGADDMIPQVEGFDEIILSDMEKHYPDTDGMLFYNDGYTGERLNTIPILGKKYYRRFGYVYHPSYISLWADNEYMEQAKKLGKMTYFDKVIIRHEHPANNSAVAVDDLYEWSESFFQEDKKVFDKRKAEGFKI